MNTKILGMLLTATLLNTACSKEENRPPSYTNTSTTAVASESTATTNATSSTEVIESTLADQESTDTTAAEFLNTHWSLIVLNGEDITFDEKERKPHVIFNADNRISGSDGCNSIMGTYTVDGDKLTFSQVASTMMACAEGGEHAHDYKNALEKTTTFDIHSDQLVLHDEKGLAIARFKAVHQH